MWAEHKKYEPLHRKCSQDVERGIKFGKKTGEIALDDSKKFNLIR